MKLSDLISTLPLPSGSADPQITHLTADSRAVKKGSLFAALRGSVSDGRDYIPAAIAAGASAILSEKGLSKSGWGDTDVPYIGVKNPRETYAYIAARLYAGQPETVVAVTGTNGKSSTVEFLRQIWDFAGFNAACFGTLGIAKKGAVTPLSHTTPDAAALQQTLADLKSAGITHCGMEASSHGLDQYRLDGTRLAAVGFTNLTQDHLDYHETFEAYFEAKSRLFTALAPKTVPAVMNVDSDYGKRMADLAETAGLDVMRLGRRGVEIKILAITPHAFGQTVSLSLMGKPVDADLPLLGEYQVFNVISAMGLAIATGVSEAVALSALSELTGVNGRMETAGITDAGAPVIIDFAHTPAGLETLLRGLRPHTQARMIIVFGCGGDRDKGKRPKMGRIASQAADVVIVTDDNPRTEDAATIRAQVMTGYPDAIEIGDRAEAIAAGVAMLKKGDCLVIAGKGHESGQIVGDTIIPFKDIDVARKALEAGS